MKKYLRGKRYIRARASVARGREKRRERKVKRWSHSIDVISRLMSQIDWEKVEIAFQQAVEEMVENVRRVFGSAAQELKDRLEAINELNEKPGA